MITRPGCILIALLVLLAGVGMTRADDNAPAAETLRITLPQALPYEKRRDDRHAWQHDRPLDLQLDLTRRAYRWDPAVWGWTADLPGQEHLGRLTEIKEQGDRITLTVEMTINHTRQRFLALGGPVTFQIELTRTGDTYTGRFTSQTESTNTPTTHAALEAAWGWGSVPGQKQWRQDTVRNRLFASLATAKATGEATAEFVPALLPTAVEDLPLAGDEHPRLLFRREQIESLRQHMKTPEGRRIIAEMKALLEAGTRTMPNMHAVGNGLLYQLTGEQHYAEAAGRQAQGWFYTNYPYGWWGIHPYSIMGSALAYDLCYDAWDPQLRATIYANLEQNIRHLTMRHDGLDLLNTNARYRFANPEDEFRLRSSDDGKAAKYRAAAAIAALAIMNDEPPAFRPTPLDDVHTIPPADDYDPWVGVPVLPFEDDVMPRQWLVNGPFLPGTSDRFIEAVHGGWGKLRPEPGQTITVDGTDLDWRRYDPARNTGTSPMIYPRNCNRFWTSSTGAGYPPGKALVRRWRDAGKDGRIGVVLYTVIRNDRPRIVQPLPNWRSHSTGARMWINGQQVQDGQLVRLEPGLYPLVVDTPIMGTYSNQSPRLAEYTEADYRRDDAAWRSARAAFTGRGPLENQHHRNFIALMRSVMRYVDREVGSDGWGGFETHDTVLPLMTILHNVAGRSPAADTGLSELMHVATRMRGHARPTAYDFMTHQSFAPMVDAQHPAARWYLDQHGYNFRTPAGAAIAFTTNPRNVQPTPAGQMFDFAHRFDRHGVVTFNSALNGEGHQVLFNTAAGSRGSLYAAGNFTLHAFGRHWIQPGPDGHWLDYDFLNNPSVAGYYPVDYGRITHEDFRPDGSGSVTVLLDKFRPAHAGHKEAMVFDGPVSELAIQRSLAVDYSGKAGAPVIVIIADKYLRAGKQEMTWRARLGNLGRGKDDILQRLQVHHNGFDLQPRARDELPFATMQVRMNNPLPLVHESGRYHDGRDYFIELKMNRKPTQMEKIQRHQIDRHTDDLESVVSLDQSPRDLPPAPEPPQERQQQQNQKTPDVDPTDPVLESVLDEFKADLEAEQTQRERDLPPTVLLTVITVQPDAPPTIRFEGKADNQTAHVGNQTYHFDGKKITINP